MMKIRLFLPLYLMAVLLAACSPAEATAFPNPPVTTQLPTASLPTVTVAAPTLEAATQIPSTEEAAVLPVATSRGLNLEATDPRTVILASGGLQFVEFFRFT